MKSIRESSSEVIQSLEKQLYLFNVLKKIAKLFK